MRQAVMCYDSIISYYDIMNYPFVRCGKFLHGGQASTLQTCKVSMHCTAPCPRSYAGKERRRSSDPQISILAASNVTPRGHLT